MGRHLLGTPDTRDKNMERAFSGHILHPYVPHADPFHVTLYCDCDNIGVQLDVFASQLEGVNWAVTSDCMFYRDRGSAGCG